MNEISWDIKVPIFRNKLILKQLGLAIGVPFGILTIFLILIKAYYGIIILGATFVIAFLLVLLIFRGTYDVQYKINHKGILCQTQKNQREKVLFLSSITFLLGLVSNNLTAAGAGLIPRERTSIFIPWKRIGKAKLNEKQKLIMIYGGFAENIVLFCKEDNYEDVMQYINDLNLICIRSNL